MKNKMEFKGEWWIPNHSDNALNGVLKFIKHEGWILEVMGSLNQELSKKNYFAPEIILGSANGHKITLQNCIERGNSHSFPGIYINKFTYHFCFVGCHFQKVEDIKFKQIDVHYSNLNEWTCSRSLTTEDNASDDIKMNTEVIAKYTRPKPVQININDSLDLVISSKLSISESQWTKIQMEGKDYIEIKFKEEKKFIEFYKKIHEIQNFLTIGIGVLVYPLKIEGFTKLEEPVDVYGFQFEETDVILNHSMVFSLEDNWVASNLNGLFQKWFEMADYLESSYHLYFDTLYNSTNYLIPWFLSLAQALESYYTHSKKNFEGKYLEDKSFKNNIYKPIKKFIDEDNSLNDFFNDEFDNEIVKDFKNSIKERIRFGNEPSLKTKILIIFGDNEEFIGKIINDKDSFIEKFKCTRDYLTHYSKKQKECSASDEELIEMCHILQELIEMLLMKEIDFHPYIIQQLQKSKRHVFGEVVEYESY